jgi:HK97 family phage major capsid protein
MPVTPTSKSLREQELLPRAKEIRRLADLVNNEKRSFTAEEQAAWETVNKEYEEHKARIEILEKAESRQADLTQDAAPAVAQKIRSQDYNGKKGLKQLRRMQAGPERDRAEKELAERRAATIQAKKGWLRDTDPRGFRVTEEHRALALQAWCRKQSGMVLSPEHVDACERTGIDPRAKELSLDLPGNYRQVRAQHGMQSRALSINSNTAGGYTVPEGFVQNLEVALLQYANVREWADVMRTTSGQDLPWPTINDVNTKGVLLQENTTVSTGDITFGQVVFKAYKYSSKEVLVPVELLEDSAFDLSSTLGELLGIRIARIQADHFTTGTGASQPTGYMTAATLGVTAASATAIASDELYKLKHTIDPAYRAQQGVGWLMHDQVLLAIKLLKDQYGRYLWQASLAGGRPDTIDGDPVYINQSMASSVATGNKTIAYGALRKYKIRDVSQIRMRRLVERYADADQEAFLMFMRSDANLLDAGTHPIKYLQQA